MRLRIAQFISVLALLTALIALVTEGIKFSLALPTPTPVVVIVTATPQFAIDQTSVAPTTQSAILPNPVATIPLANITLLPSASTRLATFASTLTRSPTPSLTSMPTTNPTVVFCQALQKSFPQTLEEIKRRFDLPDTKTGEFKLVTELCPGIASGFWIHDAVTEFQIVVPPNGCIDSWAGDTTYIGDVGTPVPDSFGGFRVYKGTVRTVGMTCRAAGCGK